MGYSNPNNALEPADFADQLDRSDADVGNAQLNSHSGSLVNGRLPAFWYRPSSPVDKFASAGGYQVAAPS